MLKIQAMEIIGGDLSARPAASLQKFPALCAMVAMP
jgi:hypothetical protein